MAKFKVRICRASEQKWLGFYHILQKAVLQKRLNSVIVWLTAWCANQLRHRMMSKLEASSDIRVRLAWLCIFWTKSWKDLAAFATHSLLPMSVLVTQQLFKNWIVIAWEAWKGSMKLKPYGKYSTVQYYASTETSESPQCFLSTKAHTATFE